MTTITKPVHAEVTVTRRDQIITAGHTSAGDSVMYAAGTSKVVLMNARSPAPTVEYRVNSNAWVRLGARQSAELDINLASATLKVRRSEFAPDSMVVDLEIHSLPDGLFAGSNGEVPASWNLTPEQQAAISAGGGVVVVDADGNLIGPDGPVLTAMGTMYAPILAGNPVSGIIASGSAVSPAQTLAQLRFVTNSGTDALAVASLLAAGQHVTLNLGDSVPYYQSSVDITSVYLTVACTGTIPTLYTNGAYVINAAETDVAKVLTAGVLSWAKLTFAQSGIRYLRIVASEQGVISVMGATDV